ncbi:hypothetical protein KIN20_023646 [Parelaphostrongylus tenuis]|uniref:Uncharacterized protein n=1 Tax=Parelaphostrongylus tenuis TaxID=148309 RepID=A0AAD5NAA5_PARTN|nr:hypothetical protein KIN20_023646 [Parelaphostrongylus tenuis]
MQNSCPDCFDEIRDTFEENGGLYRMERVQESESEKVYHTACHIITDFFNGKVNEEESKSYEKNQPMDFSF